MRSLCFTLFLFAPAAGCYSPALGQVGFFCHPGDKPACPDGTMCLPYVDPNPPHATQNRCQAAKNPALVDMAGGLIPKQGTPYTGLHTDPGLNIPEMMCPDFSLEPNDTQPTALEAPPALPDQPTPKVTKMAICPTGPSQFTGNHDVDFFHLNVPQPSTNLKVDLFYDITFGDLDVGVFDAGGNLIAYDGTAVTNGCVTKQVTQGDYYVAVVGANNVDVNRYDIRMATFSTAQTCPPPM